MAIVKNFKLISMIKTNNSVLENMPVGLLHITSFILRLREGPADLTVTLNKILHSTSMLVVAL